MSIYKSVYLSDKYFNEHIDHSAKSKSAYEICIFFIDKDNNLWK